MDGIFKIMLIHYWEKFYDAEEMIYNTKLTVFFVIY